MKKHLLTLLSLTISSVGVFAQDYCRILTDSVESGTGATSHSTYFYNSETKLIKVEKVDSNSTTVNYMDTIIYNTEGRIDSVLGFEYWTGSMNHVVDINYDAFGKITRINETGDNGSPWRKSYDMFYNAADELEAMRVDQSNLLGQPEGIVGDWENIVWDAGNAISATLVIDILGTGNPDQIELNISYDTMNNISRLKLFSDATDALFRATKNNSTNVKFAQTENIGGFPIPAGTSAFQTAFTYNSYNEADTEESLPTMLQSSSSLTRYTFDCSISNAIEEVAKDDLTIYPNPSSGTIHVVSSDAGLKNLNVYNLQGEIVWQQRITDGVVDITSLPAGIYVCEISSDHGITRKKIIKE